MKGGRSNRKRGRENKMRNGESRHVEVESTESRLDFAKPAQIVNTASHPTYIVTYCCYTYNCLLTNHPNREI